MGKIGVISVIPKDYSNAFPTMEKSLREVGMSRFPSTFRMVFPYKERSGKRRTGLDPQATYIFNIQDKDIRESEIRRVTDLRDRLQSSTGLDLGSTSAYWNKIDPVKLRDGDNMFNLDVPEQAIAFAWLRVHPTIASSLEAYHGGEYPPDTQFYVKDADREQELEYNKKKALNEAINKMESFSLSKRRKVARLVGLPVTEDTREEVVYNALDEALRGGSLKTGPFSGQDAIRIFNSFASLSDNTLEIKDLVEQALRKQIYREGKAGKIYEGETVRFQNREDMNSFFLDDSNQNELLELEQRLKAKELIK